MALFKRNKEDKKRQESAIGKIIYGFLLFMPLLSITTKCLYVAFNKNAFESYSGQEVVMTGYEYDYKYETNNVNSFEDFIIGNVYHFELSETEGLTLSDLAYDTTIQFIILNGSLYLDSDNNYGSIDEIITPIEFTANNVYSTVFEYDDIYISSSTNDTYINYYVENINSIYGSFDFQLTYLDYVENEHGETLVNYVTLSAYNIIESIIPQYTTKYYLDNAFEYSIKQTEESNLFNWAKQTGTYTVLQQTCNSLGITNTFTPMLMTYWLLISIIYFIFDIALILIWMIHNKIHELQESI